MMKYNKTTIDYAINIRVFYDGNVSYLTVFTDDVLNTTNNEIVFTELRRVLRKLLIINSKKDLFLSTRIF